MKTAFTPQMLADPEIAQADAILRQCTNCGCCNAACPTHELTGDEREAPRGRINLIREMLEVGRVPEASTVRHLDSCLSCMACTVACPSGVDYMHLVDHARVHIERTYTRPAAQWLTRQALARVLPHAGAFRAAAAAGRLARPMATMLRKSAATRPLAAMLEALPRALAPAATAVRAGVHPAVGPARKRVLLPVGCVQPALDPGIDRAAIHLLTHLGVEVVVPPTGQCCGAIDHHLGREEAARTRMRANLDAWAHAAGTQPVDALLSTASGCGSTMMDYGHILASDTTHAETARHFARMAMDIGTFLCTLDLPPPKLRPGLRVAYQAACSLQHAQGRLNEPKQLLRRAGFVVLSPKDEHLCCGSAGTYSLLHAETAMALRDRKIAALEQTRADVISGGNIGCLQHLGPATQLPVVHTVMLLDWAWTGAVPARLAALQPSLEERPSA